jgi:hypothetical protein
MSEVARIRGLYKSICVGPAWHGPSLAENLKDVTAEQAARHPIAGSHSIWEIVRHVIAWEREVTEAIGGKRLVTLAGENDWPPVADDSEAAWRSDLAALASGHKELAAALKAFPEEKLNETVADRDFTWHVLLHGIIHHSLYHSGQSHC